jgi:hypothetical protein
VEINPINAYSSITKRNATFISDLLYLLASHLQTLIVVLVSTAKNVFFH